MKQNDDRRYRRISVSLPVRIVINAIDEYEGRVINISPGDMAIIVDAKATIGDAIVAHIKGLDVIEGTVARAFPDGISVSFMLSKRRRALLTEQLMLRANAAHADGLGDRRSAPRHRNMRSRSVCRLADGAALFVRVLDISVDGMAVEAQRKPDIGSPIHIGARRGMVVRHTPRGFAVLFDQSAEKNQQTAQPILRAV